MYSLIIPVYRNEDSIPELLTVLKELNKNLDKKLEVVFVIDGSPDRSFGVLENSLPACEHKSKLLVLSRNFGAFSAIRAGMAEAEGPYFAVMAADLQEPSELILKFFRTLETESIDVTIGTRRQRNDPLFSRLGSQIFWFFYRKFVQKEMPPGGVDIFGCNMSFRDQLLALDESNSSLVGLLFWLGFRRKLIGYERRARSHGKSAWTLGRKLRYLMDSIFAFSDLPIRLLVLLGGIGLVFSVIFSILVLFAKISGVVPIPGYAATVLIILFFAALNTFGMGIIGSYVWRAFENTKHRPQVIVRSLLEFDGKEV
jgi:glycosyltransferase involved in cell wall biosynthesis